MMMSRTRNGKAISMPGQVPPVVDEREALLAYLAQQRYVLRLTAFGLTDDQARAHAGGQRGRASVGSSSTSRRWSRAGSTSSCSAIETQEEYADDFRVGPGETLASILAGYDDIASETDAVVAKIADLGQAVPVPKGVPWFPDDVDAWSVRWVLLHLIEETPVTRGTLTSSANRSTERPALPLRWPRRRWPATDWLQPWQPS